MPTAAPINRSQSYALAALAAIELVHPMSDTDPKHHRRIRSYVLRDGRLTAGQQNAFNKQWPAMGIEFQSEPLDFATIFGNTNPVKLEIGFGNGESLVQMAAADPECNYLGIEVHRPGVGHLLIKAGELELSNLRVMRHDAIEVLDHCIKAQSLAGLFLFFPDPWHKKRHNKRRILNPAFIERLAKVIQPGGFFHAATDWQEYAEQMMEVLSSADDLFSNTANKGQYVARPNYRPLTKFEQRGKRLGHGVWDLIFLRC